MAYADVKPLTPEAARALVATKREELRVARFRVRHGEEKDVRRIRELRTEIAHLLTHLRAAR